MPVCLPLKKWWTLPWRSPWRIWLKCTLSIIFIITILPGLVFQLNGTQYGNNSVVDPSDIGEDERGLFCLTSFLECCRGGVFGSRGNWVDERGVNVSTRPESEDQDLEFYNNRGMGAVRLNRRFTGTSGFAGGMYKCVIPDANNTFRDLFIGIYPPNFGECPVRVCMYVCVYVCVCSETSDKGHSERGRTSGQRTNTQ